MTYKILLHLSNLYRLHSHNEQHFYVLHPQTNSLQHIIIEITAFDYLYHMCSHAALHLGKYAMTADNDPLLLYEYLHSPIVVAKDL